MISKPWLDLYLKELKTKEYPEMKPVDNFDLL